MDTVFVVLLITLSLPAVFTAVMLLFPAPISQARYNLETHPWRSFFLGLLTFAAVVLLEGLLISVAVTTHLHLLEEPVFISFLGIVLIVTLGMPLLIGLNAAVQLTSRRLGELKSPALTYLRGGGLLLLACLMPFVGWFVFTPTLAWVSIGSVVGLLRRKKGAPDSYPSTASTDSISGKN